MRRRQFTTKSSFVALMERSPLLARSAANERIEIRVTADGRHRPGLRHRAMLRIGLCLHPGYKTGRSLDESPLYALRCGKRQTRRFLLVSAE